MGILSKIMGTAQNAAGQAGRTRGAGRSSGTGRTPGAAGTGRTAGTGGASGGLGGIVAKLRAGRRR